MRNNEIQTEEESPLVQLLVSPDHENHKPIQTDAAHENSKNDYCLKVVDENWD